MKLSAMLALFPLCLADCKHKLFWCDTRELEQKTRLRKCFFNLDLTLNVTRDFKRAKSLFMYLKPTFIDLAQFVSTSPLSMFHLDSFTGSGVFFIHL